MHPCPYCDGEAALKSPMTVSYEILRRLERERQQVVGREVLITAHPAVAHFLLDEERENLEAMEIELQTRISVKGDPALHQEHFKVEPF
jgi:ribonuclease G